MKKNLFLAILLLTFSCKNDRTETQLKKIYEEIAHTNNDSLIIENLEILKFSKVDLDYVKNTQINNLNHIIDLKKKVIDNDKENIRLLKRNIKNRNKLIKLNHKEKEEYLAEIQLDKLNLKKTENDIEKNENSIAIIHQKIVLLKAEIGQNKESEFNLVEYVFKGSINNEKVNDTISLLMGKDYLPKFVNNDRFTDYMGK